MRRLEGAAGPLHQVAGIDNNAMVCKLGLEFKSLHNSSVPARSLAFNEDNNKPGARLTRLEALLKLFSCCAIVIVQYTVFVALAPLQRTAVAPHRRCSSPLSSPLLVLINDFLRQGR